MSDGTAAPGVARAGAPEVDQVLVLRTGRKLHVPDGEGPLCATRGEMREKPIAAFPEAHREWCATCLDCWRHRNAN